MSMTYGAFVRTFGCKFTSYRQGRSQDFQRGGGAEGGSRDLPIGPNSVCFVESSIFTAFV